MSLRSFWEQSLPDCGFAVTSTLVVSLNVYAGCNGYVYLLHAPTGKVLHKNSLPGRGHNEVRLAITDDRSTLLVGTHGYIIGLDSANLSRKWETSLTGCGYGIVNIITAGDTGYAACNSNVYSFKVSSGVVQHRNPLSGREPNEAHLALASGNFVLLVGINGSAIGLAASDLRRKWENSLPGSGYGITSVLGNAEVCYTACNGYLYMLDASTGKELHQNSLSNTGKGVTRLTLRDDGGVLFVGVNGYGAAVKAVDISTIYIKSLPDCGYNITDVVSGKIFTYFGCNGFVYGLDEDGNILAQNGLPGLGKHETRLALDPNEKEHVFAGIWGYSVGLVPIPLPQSGPWMTRSAATIGPRMLRQIAIPGSHDSGTYAITPFSPVGKDLPWYVTLVDALPFPPGMIKEIITFWSIAQPDNFFLQLKAGVRYLDLRVQGGGSLNFVHGLVSAPIWDLLGELSTFLSIPGYDREVVILDFNHFYDMEPSDHNTLIGLLKSRFSDALAVYNPAGSNQGGSSGFDANVTLHNLWATPARIIVFYAHDASVRDNHILWPNEKNEITGPAIISPWPGKAKFADIKTFLDNQLPYTGPIPFVLQCQVTPDEDLLLDGVFRGSLNSLSEVARVGNPQIIQWLNGWGPKLGINIVIADWITAHPDLIQAILGLNGANITTETPPAAMDEKMLATELPAAPNTILTREDFIKALEDGSMKLTDIIERTHTRAFQILGQNLSQEKIKALMELDEFVENSEVGRNKLVRKPDVVHDPAKTDHAKADDKDVAESVQA